MRNIHFKSEFISNYITVYLASLIVNIVYSSYLYFYHINRDLSAFDNFLLTCWFDLFFSWLVVFIYFSVFRLLRLNNLLPKAYIFFLLIFIYWTSIYLWELAYRVAIGKIYFAEDFLNTYYDYYWIILVSIITISFLISWLFLKLKNK